MGAFRKIKTQKKIRGGIKVPYLRPSKVIKRIFGNKNKMTPVNEYELTPNEQIQ